MPEHMLGRRISPDERDRRYPMRLMFRREPPPARLFRNFFLPAELPMDQGATGTCVAHAWRGFLLGAPLTTETAPNPYDMYRQLILLDEWPDNDYESTSPDHALQSGSSVRAGVKYLQSQGYIQSYVWASSAEDCARWILGGYGTVVMGTNWYSGMETPDRYGRVRVEGDVLGGHAWLLFGYNRMTKLFRAMNSWGTGWGKRGRFQVGFEDLDRLIHEQGEACAAVEQEVQPV